MTDSPRRGRKPGTDKLTDTARRNLIERLRTDTGPVNLKATALEVGISRPTLMRYIAAEPGLQEAVNARRKSAGRGYVTEKRRRKPTPQVVGAAVAARDPLPTGPAAEMFAKLWRGLAAEHRWDLELNELARASADSPDAHEEVLQQQLDHALAHAKAFEVLAKGQDDHDKVRAQLDALTRPRPLPVQASDFLARERAADEKAAQDFKAIHGYRPSALRLAELRGKPTQSFTSEQWAEDQARRDLSRALKKAVDQRKPRKSYPPRPKDAQGRPLVPRGHMAELLRQQEAKGLTGQAARDAATAAALAALAAQADSSAERPGEEPTSA